MASIYVKKLEGNYMYYVYTHTLLVGGLEHEFYFPQELGWWSNLTFTPSFFRGVGIPWPNGWEPRWEVLASSAAFPASPETYKKSRWSPSMRMIAHNFKPKHIKTSKGVFLPETYGIDFAAMENPGFSQERGGFAGSMLIYPGALCVLNTASQTVRTDPPGEKSTFRPANFT